MDLNLPATPLPREPLSNRSRRSARTRAWGALSTAIVATIAAVSAIPLGACGGGNGVDESGDVRALASTAPPAPTARKAGVDFTLESEFGPGDAPGSTTRDIVAVPVGRAGRSAEPVDPLAQTWAGRYVSRAVAERTSDETGGRVVWVDASCCAGLDPELPERIAFGMQAILGEEATVYVSGSDLRQAARLADRLDALGLRRVYLVTP